MTEPCEWCGRPSMLWADGFWCDERCKRAWIEQLTRELDACDTLNSMS